MRNRAKCKLCQSIIESFHRHDYVSCKCGEISVDGGLDYLRAGARNWSNFIRIDDEGNEILVKVKDEPSKIEENKEESITNLSKAELLDMLDAMAKNIENLPQQAMSLPINHYDFYSFMVLVSSILRTSD